MLQLLLAVSLAALVGSIRPRTPPLSLDAFLSLPYRSHLTACGDCAAWSESRRGLVNIFAACGTDQTQSQTQLSHHDQDDGLAVFSIHFVNSCRHVVVSFGPTAAANPAHKARVPAPFSTSVYAVDGTGGKTEIVPLVDAKVEAICEADSGSPVMTFVRDEGPVSFDGTVGHLSSASVYNLPLLQRSKRGPRNSVQGPKRLFSVKQGSLGDLVWSDNGAFLAFSNDRGTHSFIGIWRASDPERIQWISPSADYDVSPTISPDGSRIAWLRQYGPKNEYDRYLGGHRGPSFSVMVAPVSSQQADIQTKASTVYTDVKYGYPDSTSGYGKRSLTWLNNEAVVFGSEESSGWCHPFVANIKRSGEGFTADLRDLTPGNFEAKAWMVYNESSVLVVHNLPGDVGEGNLETRVVSHVNARDSGPVIPVFSGDVHHITGMSSDGLGVALGAEGFVYALRTSVAAPTVVVRTQFRNPYHNVNDYAVISGPVFELPKYVVPEDITIKSSDGEFDLSAQLFMPSSKGSVSEMAIPGVIFTHGGSERQMFTSFHFSPTYAALYALNQYIATVKNMAVLSVNYRSGVGYGHKFRVCEKCMWLGGQEYLDVKEAAKVLASRKSVNRTRIGIYGLSYGGLNALQALFRNSDIFAAGVANAPVFNWVSQARRDGAKIFDIEPLYTNGFHALPVGPMPNEAGAENYVETVRKRQAVAVLSSPVRFLANLTSPLLLIQGDADDEVAFSESIGVISGLRSIGKADLVSSLVFPDETHGLAKYQSQLRAAQATTDFLEDNL